MNTESVQFNEYRNQAIEMDTVFSNILNERLEGVNLSHLARQLEIPKTLLFEWKMAKRTPSLKNISHVKKIADYLGMSLEEILIGEAKPSMLTSVAFEDEGRKYKVKIERVK